jgi:glycine cleavage system aminomethyltransferase T
VTVENVTDDTGVLSVVGPKSRQVLADAIGDQVQML